MAEAVPSGRDQVSSLRYDQLGLRHRARKYLAQVSRPSISPKYLAPGIWPQVCGPKYLAPSIWPQVLSGPTIWPNYLGQ